MLYPNNKIKEGQEHLYETGGLDLNSLKSNGYFVSIKRDGVRAELGNGRLKTRALKPFPNEHLPEYFEELLDLTEGNNIILEGELYSPSTSFDVLSGILRSKDKDLPEDLEFYCFDILDNTVTGTQVPFSLRYQRYRGISATNYVSVEHYYLTVTSIGRYYQTAISQGYEGIILRNPSSMYKLGRVTHTDNIAYKMKETNSYDCTILGYEPEYTNTSESYINELGYKQKHKRKADRVPLERLGAIIADYQGQRLKVMPAMTQEEAEYFWKIKEAFIGNTIEVKGTESSKGRLRHPVLVRVRGVEDKDES